jgi:hypothetical protein
MTGALDDLLVVDVSTLFAGPMTAMHLGDLGAQVVKVEHPRRPDPARGHGPEKDGHNLWYKTLGRNKRSVQLDLSSEGGAEAFRRLAARADVVVAAAAAGLPPPAMAVFTDVRDLEGLAESCQRGRAVGLLGRTAIHPNQLDVILAAFTPTDGEVAQAREVLTRAAESAAAGHGAVALPDGRFVDAAVLRQARRVFALVD